MHNLRRWRRAVAGGLAAAGIAAVFAVASIAASSGGQPPPEVTPQTDAWPAHNYDLANSRATTKSQINAANVATLKRKWQFKIPGTGPFGIFATTPVVLNRVVYFQDLNSNVYALDEASGKLKWKHAFNAVDLGPNGVAYGYGRLYGATEKFAFALNPANGAVVWRHTLVKSVHEGIDMTPQVYDNKVLISTVPGSGVKHFYEPKAVGIVYALDAATGKPIWSFDTVPAPKKGSYSGGGLWYPPAVDAQGDVYLGVANPGLWPSSPKNPNGALRPGANLYTDSLVVLDGATGKLKWYHQVVTHDVRDYDLMISPILAANGSTQLVLGTGKMGRVYAWNAADGKPVWQAKVGKHLNEFGPLPKRNVTICPGNFGGVETPMAEADGTLFVPWIDLCAVGSATSEAIPQSAWAKGTGGLTAFDVATGKVKWQQKIRALDFGAATVANDVVFTSDINGKIYAFSTVSGKLLWSTQAPAGVNGFPAVTDKMLIVGAGTAGLGAVQKPVFSIVAYSLG
jgi:outer membrane protein assembly factor BamB